MVENLDGGRGQQAAAFRQAVKAVGPTSAGLETRPGRASGQPEQGEGGSPPSPVGLTVAHLHATYSPSGALDGLDMVRPA